jgi:hypothetical protein
MIHGLVQPRLGLLPAPLALLLVLGYQRIVLADPIVSMATGREFRPEDHRLASKRCDLSILRLMRFGRSFAANSPILSPYRKGQPGSSHSYVFHRQATDGEFVQIEAVAGAVLFALFPHLSWLRKLEGGESMRIRARTLAACPAAR